MSNLGYEDVEKLIPLAEEVPSRDPVSENMVLLQNRPIKVFPGQHHHAHLAVHMAAVQDPVMREMVGQSSNGPAIMAAAQAHILEHLSYIYRESVEQALGMQLPPPGEPLPPEIENHIAALAAQAAVTIGIKLPKPEEKPDPLLMIQMQDQKLKEAELQLKAAQLQATMEQARMRQETDNRRDETRREQTVLNTLVAEKQIETEAALKTAELLNDKEQAEADRALDAADRGIKAGFKSAEIDAARRQLEQSNTGEQ